METVKRLRAEDSGQDLIEYAMVAALIALAAVAGMTSVASAVNSTFTVVGGKLAQYLS